MSMSILFFQANGATIYADVDTFCSGYWGDNICFNVVGDRTKTVNIEQIKTSYRIVFVHV